MVVDLAVNSRLAIKEPLATLHFAEGMVVGLDVNTPTAQRAREPVSTIAYLMVDTTPAPSLAAHVPHFIPLLTAGSTTRINAKWQTRRSWL